MNFRKAVFILSVALCAVLFFDGLYVLAGIGGEQPIQEKQPETGRVESGPEVREETQPMAGAPVNLLVLGLDGEEVRSDVILLLNFLPEQGKLNVLSFARDTRVKARGRTVKINALFAMGGEAMIAQEVEEITGLPVDYYLTLNFRGFREIIDLLDGVEIDVPFNMNYDDPDQNLHIHLKKGRQVLDGKKAEQFVRYRKGNTSGQGYSDGDLGRIKAQQDFLRALIQQKVKLKYISKLDDIFFVLKNHMKTNIEIGDIRRYLQGIRKIKAENVTAYTTPGDSDYIDKTWYFIQDTKKTREMIDSYFFK